MDYLSIAAPLEFGQAGQRRPGEASWQRVLAQVMIKIDTNKWIPEILKANEKARSEALAYLASQLPASELVTSVVVLSLQNIASLSTHLDNAIMAIDILARLPDDRLELISIWDCADMLSEVKTPTLREALWPLVARCIELVRQQRRFPVRMTDSLGGKNQNVAQSKIMFKHYIRPASISEVST